MNRYQPESLHVVHPVLYAAVVAFAMILLAAPASAQTFEDALRFGERSPATGVRSLGMGGVGIAGLGDYSDLINNPAGLGYMRHSTFTAGLNTFSTDDQALYRIGSAQSPFENDITDTQIGQVGYFHKAPTRRGSLVAGIGINQIASFSRELQFSGQNGDNSVTDFFLPLPGEFTVDVDNGPDGTFGTDDDVFSPSFDRPLSFIAFETFGIDFDPDAFDAGADVPFFPAVTRGTVAQTGSIAERGSLHEVNLAGAWEAAPNVMVGVGVNVPFGRWELERFVSEEDVNNDNDGTGGSTDFDYLEWTETVDSEIVGVNARAGVSVEASGGFRAGVSVETPTYYEIKEDFATILSTEFDDGFIATYGDSFSEDVGAGSFEYNVITPWRVGIGGSYQNGNLRIGADAELIDWSQLEMDSDLFSFAEENRIIRQSLEAVVNTRIGGEYRFDQIVVRAGVAFKPDPRKQNVVGRGAVNPSVDRDKSYFSLGLSYRPTSRFALDIGLLQERFDDEFVPYAVTGGPVVDEEVVRNQLSVGVRFGI